MSRIFPFNSGCWYQDYTMGNVSTRNRFCKSCNEHIPSRVVINGVKKNIGSRLYCLECSPFGLSKKQLYLQNPNKCLYCGNDILVREGESVAAVKVKIFCNSSCSAKYRNKQYNYKVKLKKECKSCGAKISTQNTYCNQCKEKRKSYYANRPVTDVDRFQINQNARKVASVLPNICIICGYDKHVEVCHIKAVSSFLDSASLSDINDIKNLIKLCPNCHWEFDNGITSF